MYLGREKVFVSVDIRKVVVVGNIERGERVNISKISLIGMTGYC